MQTLNDPKTEEIHGPKRHKLDLTKPAYTWPKETYQLKTTRWDQTPTFAAQKETNPFPFNEREGNELNLKSQVVLSNSE